MRAERAMLWQAVEKRRLVGERMLVSVVSVSLIPGEHATTRGADTMQGRLFTMAGLEDFVPADHPLMHCCCAMGRTGT
jgi:hypothetical protein